MDARPGIAFKQNYQRHVWWGGRSEDGHLFYFFKSYPNPRDDPLILWMSGSPGRSSFTAFLRIRRRLSLIYFQVWSQLEIHKHKSNSRIGRMSSNRMPFIKYYTGFREVAVNITDQRYCSGKVQHLHTLILIFLRKF
ncbi:hypothetical protein POM88_000981 [Heracleum sosnowskyi]|uniref:Uncharacterized protein n=1 Tax=Heracleum sosnowskyi TaxID=360622 RepID=A0AAD8JCU7_9APIA|nr:hypothetical protein POM88_000981 [Heracleum sosnowskyi]